MQFSKYKSQIQNLFFQDGYQLKGDIKTTCVYGNWTGRTPSCEEMYCPFPGYLDNGKVGTHLLLIGLIIHLFHFRFCLLATWGCMTTDLMLERLQTTDKLYLTVTKDGDWLWAVQREPLV